MGRPIRAALVGDGDAGLFRLLADVMSEMGLDVALSPLGQSLDIAFVVVTRADVVENVCAARAATSAPVLALLAIRDERLARRAADCGARCCYALDTPLELLRQQLVTLLSDAGAGARPLNYLFQLGPRACHFIEQLRGAAANGASRNYRVAPDAERRLESAIRADTARQPSRPFRFGMHGRLEVTLMRLDAATTRALERSIDEDLGAPSFQVA